MSKLEQVAEALFWSQVAAEEREVLGPWEFVREEIKAKYRAMARAAIEAMKGPTPEMRVAGAHAADIKPSTAAAIFDAMIDAILTEDRSEK